MKVDQAKKSRLCRYVESLKVEEEVCDQVLSRGTGAMGLGLSSRPRAL